MNESKNEKTEPKSVKTGPKASKAAKKTAKKRPASKKVLKKTSKKSSPKTASKKAKKKSPRLKTNIKAEAVAESDVSKFAELGLSGNILNALSKMGWSEPSEIQANLIPDALAGRDLLGQAKTGTGKTAAFALPILQMLEDVVAQAGNEAKANEKSARPVRCLILAPTRELAGQVADEIGRMSQCTALRTIVAYGGTRMRSQVMELKRHPDIVVGTPGRVMDLMERKLLHLDDVNFAVLDEVDRMLDIGFRDDIRKILSRVTGEHQTIFVSATIEEPIKRLASRYMTDPKDIFLAPDQLTVDKIDQHYISVHKKDKKRLLAELITQHSPSLAIVFTRTKRDTTFVAKYLCDKGIQAREIHGDLFQRKRERIMSNFRKGKINVLVATDLASRGLDINDISHIYNYDIPEDPEAYVHRIGRTGRMGSTGMAYLFVTPEQGDELTKIEMLINREIPCYKLDGFKPSVIEDKKPSETTRAVPVPIKKASEIAREPAKPRTLGSMYKPRRRRR